VNQSSHLPPVQCAPWCRHQNGHTDAVQPADQTCFSEPATTRLTIPQPTAARGWTSEHNAYVSLSLHHDVPDARPVVELGLNDASGILFTLDEAELFARSIWREISVAMPSLTEDFDPDSATEQERWAFDQGYEAATDPSKMDLEDVEQELRESLLDDLMRHLDRDVHRSGYIVAFVARQMPLALVEQLVDELDSVYPGRQS
jgi:hypothetical protein